MFRLDEHQVYRASSLEQFPWLDHGFGTRLSDGWPDMSRLVTPKQIHSDRVLVVPSGAPTGRGARFGEGDGLISVGTESLIGIRTADCLPILLVDARTHGVGAIHAGWRGTVSEISAKAVESMLRQFGSQPEDIWAAIGPGIGFCCFEVGPDVALRFQALFPERLDLSSLGLNNVDLNKVDLHHRSRIDLAEANRRQLEHAGVPNSYIEVSGLCTVCRANEFHSFRRDKEKAGRMLSIIGSKHERREP